MSCIERPFRLVGLNYSSVPNYWRGSGLAEGLETSGTQISGGVELTGGPGILLSH